MRTTCKYTYPVLHTWPFDKVYSSLYIAIYDRPTVRLLLLLKNKSIKIAIILVLPFLYQQKNALNAFEETTK